MTIASSPSLRPAALLLLAVSFSAAGAACRNEASAAAGSSSSGAAAVAAKGRPAIPAAVPAPVPASVVGDPPAGAAALIDARCTRCHTAARIDRNRGKDRAWWEEAVQSMVDKGARLTDAERAALLDYLTTPR